MNRMELESAREVAWGKYTLLFGAGTYRSTSFRDGSGDVHNLGPEQEIVLIGEEDNPSQNDIKIRILDRETGVAKDISIEEWLRIK